MALSQIDRDYYDNMGEMFATKGWKTLVEELTAEIYEMQCDVLEFGTVEQLMEARGVAKGLTRLINFEDLCDTQRKSLEEEDDE